MEHVTAQDFEEKVMNANTPVVLDFYADWCGPCRRLGPIFEELSSEMDEVAFFKVDVENASDLAAQFGVQSIPTIIMFNKGDMVERVMGLMPKEALADMIKKHA